MNVVKTGVMGLGNMGSSHAKALHNGEVKGASLTAVCDPSITRLQWAKEQFGPEIQLYQSTEEFFANAHVDGVIIATPHFSHPDLAVKAFQRGLHVLLEKPAGVFTKNVRQMNEAAMRSGKVFSMMFNQRMNPLYQKVRSLILSGELGDIKRTNWIITDWYRPQSYYDSSDWRATWAGEGGGIMLNQAPHQLDLWIWTTGMMPVSIQAFCQFGRHRKIEVEDEVTAYVQYENGATGLFIASIAEVPGTNRLEITGDRGKLVVEDDKLFWWRLHQAESDFNRECSNMFDQPANSKIEVLVQGKATGHIGLMENWAAAILQGTPLMAPGAEGINSLMISNAVYLSAWLDQKVTLPIDEDLYYKILQENINRSAYKGGHIHV